MGNLSDEELLDLYFAGDANGFKTFYQRHFGRVVAYASVKGLANELAQEVGQEAFLRLHRSIHAYEKGRPALPWFFTIVHNCVIDAIRQRRSLEKLRSGLMQIAPVPALSTERVQNWNPQALLGRLSAEQRQVVELRVLQEQSFREIAASTGKREATLRKRFERACSKMQEILNRGDEHGPQSK